MKSLNNISLLSECFCKPVTEQQLSDSHQSAENCIKELPGNHSILLDKMQLLVQDAKQNLQIAPLYDCPQVKANGFYSYAKLIYRFFCIIKKKRNELLNDYPNEWSDLLLNIMDAFHLIAKNFDKFRQKNSTSQSAFKRDVISINSNSTNTKEINNNLIAKFQHPILESIDLDKEGIKVQSNSLFNGEVTLFLHLMQHSNHYRDPIVKMLSSLGVFWLDKSLDQFFKFYAYLITFFHLPISRFSRCIWNKQHRIDQFFDIVRHPTFDMPFRVWNLLECSIIRHVIINFLFMNVKVTSHTFQVPRQSKHYITFTGHSFTPPNSHLDCEKDPILKTVRCRLSIPTTQSQNSFKTILLHTHGGGFVSHSPDSHETYVREWSVKLNVPVLSVDYSLCKTFPTASQEVFDVYYWLRTAEPEELHVKLGFVPEKIILIGDSAGANLMLSLCVFLHHMLREAIPVSSKLKMPDALYCIYGAFLLVPFVSTSRILGCFDTLINPEIAVFLMAVYSGSHPKIPNKSWLKSLFSIHHFEESPLLTKDGILNMDVNQAINAMQSPFASPLLYPHLNEIKDIPLFLMSTEFCPFLDESISIAKFWKGPLLIDVLDDLNHGFLNFSFMSKRAKEGVEFSTKRIGQLIDLIS